MAEVTIQHDKTLASRKPNGFTHAELLELLDYNKSSGVFRWKIKKAYNVNIGDIAGHKEACGYWVIKINKVSYKAHILAVFYVTGKWPISFVDHINCIRHDNSWSNLRLATRAQNGANRSHPRNNKSGIKGVFWHKGHRKWCAAIHAYGIQKTIGVFRNKADASAAYAEKARELYGEFFHSSTDFYSKELTHDRRHQFDETRASPREV